MKIQVIFSGKGVCVLTKSEMQQARGGLYLETLRQNILAIDGGGRGGDLSACSNKKCTKASDCSICASMTCNGISEKHCM